MKSFLGMKMWPTPVFKPFWPFFAGMAITLYGVSSIQNKMLNTEEWKKDPRSPTCKYFYICFLL
ncbi:hypothetical protein K502DRAFT_294741 [Neoconidiobolus thromboides FSU 785]|nr:hypothetical protein K502DRAFT_294741 [Neoconidiobolus thromboides FSU 785]